MSEDKITIQVTKEMIDAVDAHRRAEDKRIADAYARRVRERWDRAEKEITEKVRIILGHDITDEQFDLLSTAFREYHEDW